MSYVPMLYDSKLSFKSSNKKLIEFLCLTLLPRLLSPFDKANDAICCLEMNTHYILAQLFRKITGYS